MEIILRKGEQMEEKLRNYFLSLGFYVTRGAKLNFEGFEVSDVDLFLFARASSLTRQRINVDVKNKRYPKPFERVLWALGLKAILNFDQCFVATTDDNRSVHAFALRNGVTILDGTFLSKLRVEDPPRRLSEEEFYSHLKPWEDLSLNEGRGWPHIYDRSKSRLLTSLDYSGFNTTLLRLKYFLELIISDVQKREAATRMAYVLCSHLLLTMDFIMKDVAVLEESERLRVLDDGFQFGNLGPSGSRQVREIAHALAGSVLPLEPTRDVRADILRDFFAKPETARSAFSWAREFENLSYLKTLVPPATLPPSLRGVLSVFLDYTAIQRRHFFMEGPATPQAATDNSAPHPALEPQESMALR